MEAGKTEQDRRERVTDDLRKAMEDLRVATRNATEDVRSGIESAVSLLRDASSTATREDLDTFRDRLRSATANLLDDIEKEARKRREQLQGEGAKVGTAKSGGEEPGGTSDSAKPSGSQ
jgi:vacuolar-type H+-ATPase subunit H